MSLLSFSNGSIYKKVLLLILISLLISGCRHEKNKDIDLYNLNKDTTIEHYLPLSEYGEDYMIPDLSSKKWSKWNIYNDECKKKISNESKIYILRNIHLSDKYGNYEIKLKTDDIHIENIFEVLGVVSSITRFYDMEDCIVEDNLTDYEWELIYSYLEKILDCFENNVNFKDESVQIEIVNLHKVFSKALSGSILLLRTMIIAIASDDDIKENIGEDTLDYMIGALKFYCDEHKDNPTDKSLINAFDNIEKLGRSKHTTDCEEVQNEVKNIYMFFDKITMFKPRFRRMNVENIGYLFRSQAYKNIIDGGAQKGIAWFISRSIEIFFENMDKEKTNG